MNGNKSYVARLELHVCGLVYCTVFSSVFFDLVALFEAPGLLSPPGWNIRELVPTVPDAIAVGTYAYDTNWVSGNLDAVQIGCKGHKKTSAP